MSSKNPVTSTSRDKQILVLIAPNKNKLADGTANFLGKLDPVVIAGGKLLPGKELKEEARKRPRYIALVKLWNAHRTRNDRAIRQALTTLFPVEPLLKGQIIPPDAVAQMWSLPSGDLFAGVPEELKRQLPDALRPSGRPQKRSGLQDGAWHHIPEEISRHMKRVRFVVWGDWRSRRFQPALWCPTMKAALYALAALRELSACPMCNTAFLPSRVGQEYCTIRCRERFRQQRRREKLQRGKP